MHIGITSKYVEYVVSKLGYVESASEYTAFESILVYIRNDFDYTGST